MNITNDVYMVTRIICVCPICGAQEMFRVTDREEAKRWQKDHLCSHAQASFYADKVFEALK